MSSNQSHSEAVESNLSLATPTTLIFPGHKLRYIKRAPCPSCLGTLHVPSWECCNTRYGPHKGSSVNCASYFERGSRLQARFSSALQTGLDCAVSSTHSSELGCCHTSPVRRKCAAQQAVLVFGGSASGPLASEWQIRQLLAQGRRRIFGVQAVCGGSSCTDEVCITGSTDSYLQTLLSHAQFEKPRAGTSFFGEEG